MDIFVDSISSIEADKVFYSPETLCRLCTVSVLEKRQSFVSIFEEIHIGVIYQQILKIAKVNIEQSDPLPKSICQDCLAQLQYAIKFQTQCEKSDEVLRSYCRNEEVKLEVTDLKLETEDANEVKKEEIESELEDNLIFCDNTEIADVSSDEKKLSEFISEPQEKENIAVKKKRKQIRQKLSCDICNTKFRTKIALSQHLDNAVCNTFICDYCLRPFRTKQAIEEHMLSSKVICSRIRSHTHLFIVKGAVKRMYYCKKCPYTTKRLLYIADHLVKHTKLRPWKCELCDRTFKQSSQLKGHMEVKHDQDRENEACEICGKLFRSRRQLLPHIRYHQATEYECEICKKKYKGKLSLKAHLLRHDKNKKRYNCEECSVTFFTWSELKQHSLSHNSVLKKYKCDYCDYRSDRLDKIAKHSGKHASAKPFSCDKCGRMFLTNEKLEVHMKVHTTKGEFKCPLCPRLFFLAKSVKRHMRQNHMEGSPK